MSEYSSIIIRIDSYVVYYAIAMIFKPKCPGPLYHLSCKAAEDHNVCRTHIASVEWGREEEKDGVKILFLRPPSHDSSSNPLSASSSLEIQVS